MSNPVSPAQWILFLALYRASYETANVGVQPPLAELPLIRENSPLLTKKELEWAEKAIQRYALAQDRKWRRWREAMFETK